MTLPFLRELLEELARQGPLARVTSAWKAGHQVQLRGLTAPAQLLAAAQLQRLTQRPVLFLVPDNRTAEEWRDILGTFAELTGAAGGEEDRPLVLPTFAVDPYEGLSPHPEILEQRALALWRWVEGLPFLIAPAVAAATRLPEPDYYRRLVRRLRAGDVVDLAGLTDQLQWMGYQRQDPVEMPGQFSIRGGLVDVYSPEAARPVRIELFGDEIESLREFDPATQRSVAPLEQALLLPLTSLPLAPHLRERLGTAPAPGWEFRVAGLEGFSRSLLEVSERPPLVIVSEPEHVTAELERWWRRLRERYAPERGPEPESIFFTPEQMRERLAREPVVEMRELRIEHVDLDAEALELGAVPVAPADVIDMPTRPAPRYQGVVARMVEDSRQALTAGERLIFLGTNAGEVERLGDLFTEYKLPFQFGSRPRRSGIDYLSEKAYFSAAGAAAIVAQGKLPHGFSLPEQLITFLGSSDLFHEETAAAYVPPARRTSISTFLSDFRDLTPGDFVVHVEHGIGRYAGLKEFEAEDGASGARSGEFMILEYADAAKLYVPLTRMDLIQKYRGAEGTAPVLDRLGGTQWAQRKGRVKRAMRDMADELLKLYAARHAVRLPPCAPDDNVQREFQDAFPYAETEDQEKAIEDVRHDLESNRPMDRLVVGDVGYGKTEVAMRAAFKIVGEGRQVAVLAPTTVLAFQHEQTFRQRFRAFPVTIELLSRFRTRPQQKETLERLATGKCDIVIGTHRLLSKDVKFQNLGLLVVDEEQRFGVRHKERLKQLKKEVHVLSLSATPIPRTLNMSLAGLRDLSVIETPPRDRLAIQTVVAGWNETLIGDAMQQELARGGQVYFVHNRVDSIWEVAALLQRLAPGARIAVGHGQMAEDELEKVMLRFVRHEADVLLSTTIIENGLDIPLANTIIINRADRLGLSELYQLRGRVGRSNRRAYAFLLVPAEVELPPLARKRLAAMREFSDLGAGFKIAALDLELRGAGNLLGGEQSGSLDAVGFDLYVRMLEQTVRELKGEAVEPETEVQLHLGLDIRIPADYVPEENQRLRMYKRLAEAETEAARADVLRELEDRYGPPPAPVQNLLAYATLKPRCRQLGLTGLERRGSGGNAQLWLRFMPQTRVEPQRIAALVEGAPGAQFTPDGTLKLPFTVNGAAAVLAETTRLLDSLAPPIPVEA
ncbi:MAG: transcription-repair coupling factor [Acidobacteria bacterium]|nr:MAG: transcription-repair coupling factor [Acidobacteriota bacterium]